MDCRLAEMGPEKRVFDFGTPQIWVTVETFKLFESPKEKKNKSRGTRAGFKTALIIRLEEIKDKEQKHMQLVKSLQLL